MAKRRKHRTEIVREAVVQFVYDPITESVPSEGELEESLREALTAFDHPDVAALDRGRIGGIKTTIRKVPIEDQQG